MEEDENSSVGSFELFEDAMNRRNFETVEISQWYGIFEGRAGKVYYNKAGDSVNVEYRISLETNYGVDIVEIESSEDSLDWVEGLARLDRHLYDNYDREPFVLK